MAQLTLWNDFKEYQEVLNLEFGKLSNTTIDANKSDWDKGKTSIQIGANYNGVKIDTNGVTVVSSKNKLVLNATAGINLTKTSDNSTIFGVDAEGNLAVTGNINMTGGNIAWNTLTSKPGYDFITGTKPPVDATNTWTALTTDDRIKGLFYTSNNKLLLKADAIVVGSSTTYENGYDPTKIEIGGENIFRDSTFRKGMTYYTKVKDVDVVTEETFRGYPTLKSNQSGNTGNVYRGLEQINMPFMAGKAHTASFYVMSPNVAGLDGGLAMEIICERDDNTRTATFSTSLDKDNTPNNKWVRISATGVIPDGTTKVRVCCRVWKNGVAYIALPMFEQGTKASEHRISKEDIAESIKDSVDGINVGATRNYFFNGDFRYYNEMLPGTIAWDEKLNGLLTPNQPWSNGYNGGVTNPTIGYHAHLNTSKFGYPVLEFNNLNNQFGMRIRWLGFSQYISPERLTQIKFEPGKEYTISFEMMTDNVNYKISAGFHHTPTGTSTAQFRQYIWNYGTSTINKWEKVSTTFTIDDKFDMTKPINFYFYGANVFDNPEASGWIRNVKWEDGNKATSFSISPEEQEQEAIMASNRSDVVRVRYIRDWSDGSDKNTSNYWVQIKAMRNGTNVAKGMPVSGSGPTTAGHGLENLTNEVMITTNHTEIQALGKPRFVQVDLTKIYDDLDYIHVWRYYGDGRTFNGTRTEVSVDGRNWTPLFDSVKSGKYQETDKGFIIPVNTGRYVNTVNQSFTAMDGKLESKISETQTAINQGRVFLRGVGNNRNGTRTVSINNQAISLGIARGHNLIILQRSDLSVIYNQTYDTHANAQSDIMADKLNSLKDDVIVLITTYDSAYTNDKLATALARCGGSGKVISEQRVPQALIGVPGIGRGNGIESITTNAADAPYAEVSTLIQNGVPQGLGSPLAEVANKLETQIIQTSGRFDVILKQENGKDVINGNAIIGAINLTPSTAKIRFENIDLQGKVTFSAFDTTTANTINNKVDGNYVKNEINKVNVGVRNMVTGTMFNTVKGWERWGNTPTLSSVVWDAWNNFNFLKMESIIDGKQQVVPANTPLGLVGYGRTFEVKKGIEYTVSMNVATSEFNNLLDYMYLMYSDGGANQKTTDIRTTDFPVATPIANGSGTNYYYVSYSFIPNRDDKKACLLIGGKTGRDMTGSNGYAWIRVNNLKVEVGNKATAWAPAPEDYYAYMDDMEVGTLNYLDNSNLASGSLAPFLTMNGNNAIQNITDLNGFSKAIRVETKADTDCWAYIDLVVEPGRYTISAYMKSESSNLSLGMRDGNTTLTYDIRQMDSSFYNDKKWHRCSITVEFKTQYARLYFGASKTATAGILYLTGMQFEKGDKATAWKPSIGDVDNQIATAEQNAKDYTNVISSNESSFFHKNYNFADWKAALPNSYYGLVGSSPVKIASPNGNGNSVKFTTTAGSAGYFSQDTWDKPFSEYIYLEATFKLESGSINPAGLLFRYWRGDKKSIYYDVVFKFKDVVPSPVLNKWYTVSKVFKVPYNADFGGYGIYPMASWATIDSSQPANVFYFDSVITRAATSEEIKAYDSKVLLDANATTWSNASTLVDSWKGAAQNGKTTINGGLIQTNTILADKIAIGDFTNLSAINEDRDNLPYTVVTVGTKRYIKIGQAAYATATFSDANTMEFKVKDQYYLAFYGYKETNMNVNFIVRYHYTDGTWTNAGIIGIPITTTYGLVEAKLTITAEPTDGKTVKRVQFFVEKDSSTTGYYYLRQIELRKMYSGSLLVNGTITAENLAVNSVAATHIQANAVNATHIQSGSITTNELSVLAKDLVNNFSNTNSVEGYSIGSGGTISMVADPKGQYGKVLKMTTGSDLQITSTLFEVNSSKTYRVKVSALMPTPTATTRLYFGVMAYNANKTVIGMKQFDYASGIFDSDYLVTNPYFYIGNTGVKYDTWRDMEALVLPTTISASEQVGRGLNTNTALIMHPDTRYLAIRFFHHYSKTSVDSYYAHPSVTATDSGMFTFDQAVGGTLRLGTDTGNGFLQVVKKGTQGQQETVGQIDETGAYFPRIQADAISGGNIVSMEMNAYDLYFDSVNGNDNNPGTKASPKRNIQSYLDIMGRYLNERVGLWLQNGQIDAPLIIRGFFGPGSLTIGGADSVKRNCYGNFYIQGVTCNLYLQHWIFQGKDNFCAPGTDACIYVWGSTNVDVYNCKIYANKKVDMGISVVRGGFVRITYTEIYDVKNRALSVIYNAGAWVGWGCKGGRNPVAILTSDYAWVQGDYNVDNGASATRWDGSIARWGFTYVGGYNRDGVNWRSDVWAIDYGEATPPPPPPPSEYVREWSSLGGQNWSANGYWDDEIYVKQGTWGYGNRTGIWWFSSDLANTLRGKTIIDAQLYITRYSKGGNSGAREARIVAHQYADGRPASSPGVSNEYVTDWFSWGEGKWVNVTSFVQNKIANGVDKGFGLKYDGSSANYMAFLPQAKLWVKYK